LRIGINSPRKTPLTTGAQLLPGMFAMSHLPPPVNGGLGGGIMDGSGTINPAAVMNTPGKRILVHVAQLRKRRVYAI
jgi:hypothetical protein